MGCWRGWGWKILQRSGRKRTKVTALGKEDCPPGEPATMSLKCLRYKQDVTCQPKVRQDLDHQFQWVISWGAIIPWQLCRSAPPPFSRLKVCVYVLHQLCRLYEWQCFNFNQRCFSFDYVVWCLCYTDEIYEARFVLVHLVINGVLKMNQLSLEGERLSVISTACGLHSVDFAMKCVCVPTVFPRSDAVFK